MSTDEIFSYGYNCYNRHGSITQEIKGEIKRTFDLFDKNGKGAISCNEMLGVFRLLGMDNTCLNTEDFLKKFDKDGKGNVSYKDFETYIKQSGFLESLPDEDESHMEEAFQMLDMNKNGFIEKEELMTFLKNIRRKEVKPEEVDTMIQESDIDGDGKINYFEFKTRLVENL